MLQLTGAKISKSVQLLVTTGAGIRRVVGDHETVCAERFTGVSSEHVALDEDLVVGARMNCLRQEVLVEVVVNMLTAETACGPAGAFVLLVVVVVSDVEAAGVEIAEVGVVAHQRRLPMIV